MSNHHHSSTSFSIEEMNKCKQPSGSGEKKMNDFLRAIPAQFGNSSTSVSNPLPAAHSDDFRNFQFLSSLPTSLQLINSAMAQKLKILKEQEHQQATFGAGNVPSSTNATAPSFPGVFPLSWTSATLKVPDLNVQTGFQYSPIWNNGHKTQQMRQPLVPTSLYGPPVPRTPEDVHHGIQQQKQLINSNFPTMISGATLSELLAPKTVTPERLIALDKNQANGYGYGPVPQMSTSSLAHAIHQPFSILSGGVQPGASRASYNSEKTSKNMETSGAKKSRAGTVNVENVTQKRKMMEEKLLQKTEQVSNEESVRREAAGCLEMFHKFLLMLPSLDVRRQKQLIDHMNMVMRQMRPDLHKQLRKLMTCQILITNNEAMKKRMSKEVGNENENQAPLLVAKETRSSKGFQIDEILAKECLHKTSTLPCQPSCVEIHLPCANSSKEPLQKRQKITEEPNQPIQSCSQTAAEVQDASNSILNTSTVSQDEMTRKLNKIKEEVIDPWENAVTMSPEEKARIEAEGCIQYFNDLLKNLPNLRTQNQTMLLEHMRSSIQKLLPDAQEQVREFLNEKLPRINMSSVHGTESHQDSD